MSRFCRAFQAITLGLATVAAPCSADGESGQASDHSASRSMVYASSAALAATLSRADVAAMRSVVQPNLLKGGFGEAHMNRHLVGYLKQAGKWSPLQARLGPQGLDGLYVRYDGAGTPTGLIVSEAKYGASRLKMTNDGIQMGSRWRNVRLARMSSEYRSIAESIRSGRMALAGPGGSVGRQRLQIPLTDGKAAVFTRTRTGDRWEFVGPRALMERAGRQADLVGNYLRLASEGRMSYESAIYRIVLKNDTMRLTVLDASTLGHQLNDSALPIRKSISLPLGPRRLNQLRDISRAEIAKILRQRYPAMALSEVDNYSREIVRTTRDFEKLFSSLPGSVSRTIAWNSFKIGTAVGGVDVAVQVIGEYWRSGTVNWGRVGRSGGVTLVGGMAGSAAGQGVIVFMTENPIANQFMSRSASILGLGSRRLETSLLGEMFGAGIGGAVMAYGGYWIGLHDLEAANRMMIADGAGFVAGTAFGSGMLALASLMGTASTGTAIGSLSGAALTSATMAWLGGGSVAAGGFGMAGGAVVMTGGAALVIIGTGAAVYAIFSYSDHREDCQRISLTLDVLAKREGFISSGSGFHRFQALTIGNR